jgi:UDP-glucuronate 4-epimerase
VRILVTGAAGFIGAAVSEALALRGDSVIGIDSFNDYYPPQLKHDRVARVAAAADGRFVCRQVDFADRAALDSALANEPFDRIVHLGAQPGVRYSLENPHAYIESNVVGHVNLLELARARGVEHMVYASSSSVYGGNASVPFSVEDRVDHPWSLYAATKKADELFSETYAHLFRLPLTGLRFFTVYGPWGRPDMMPWLFTSAILEGRPIKLNNGGDMERDFTFVDDIVAGVLATLGGPPADDGAIKPGGSVSPHAIYNIGNNRAENLRRVLGIIEEACGRAAIVEDQPIPAGDVPRTCADIGPIARDFGYVPSTGVDVGMPRFVEWYRGYHGI